MREFSQIEWGVELENDAKQLTRLALEEDWEQLGDITSLAVIPREARGKAFIVARKAGILAGAPVAEVALREMGPGIECQFFLQDGAPLTPGSVIGEIQGPSRAILAAERVLLNFLGKLSGIASLTRKYVEAVQGTQARIYDTRKTTPGWRRLEKYAVKCGGGHNHRLGLFDAVLIKDNHLAWISQDCGGDRCEAVRRAIRDARRYCASRSLDCVVEIEVEDLRQLEAAIDEGPDIVLLDNMPPEQLRQAVALRNAKAPAVELEASGGVDLTNVRAIAETGVERISVGALTHKSAWLDVALDWA